MQVPVLINTDGKMEMRAVMPLRCDEPAERIPLTAESPSIAWNWRDMGGHPFVCDERHHPVRPSTVAPAPLRMMTVAQARYQVTRTIAAANAGSLQTRPLLGHNQFEGSIDREQQQQQTDDDSSGVTLEISDPEVAAPPLRLRRVSESAEK
jgi:hypothetical protein